MSRTLISPMPKCAPADSLTGHRETLARRAAWRLEDASPQTIITWAARAFGSRFTITSSMADAVLIDLVARHAPGTDVVFLDTGYHFPETLTMRDAVAATYHGRINLISVQPEQTVAEQDSEHGQVLFASNPDRCCFLRKVMPLDRVLAGYDAWGSGLRRDDSLSRSGTPVVDWDRRNGMVKVNPLARWTQSDIDIYVGRHGILTNPLLDAGFTSVGCAPCTQRTSRQTTGAIGASTGDDARSGRWAQWDKSECGIHVGVPA